MTTRIAGSPDVERAKELLRARFSFVGLTERFDESLPLMRHALGLPRFDIRHQGKNVGRHGVDAVNPSPSLDSAEAAGRIRSQSLLDLEPYEFAREELYQESARRYGQALGADLDRFRKANEGFHFRPSRRHAWGRYRKLGYAPVELAIRRRYRDSHRSMLG